MKIEGGFWENFKAALGIGLGGGLGAGFGWRFGQGLATLALRLMKWIVLGAAGIVFTQYAACTQQHTGTADHQAHVERKAAAKAKLREQIKHNPALRQAMQQAGVDVGEAKAGGKQ